MNFYNLVNQRQSVRVFSDNNISIEDIEKCVEAARLAPSATNSQPWKFIIVNDKSKINAIANASKTMNLINKFVSKSNIIVAIVLENPKFIVNLSIKIKKREWPLIDIGIAAEHFCLQATELGIGTCMVGWYKESDIKQILSVPKTKSVALLIAMGYPPSDYKIRKKMRKNIREICCYNSYE